MSSIKPEVHNALHCRQRTTENFAKFGHVVIETCEKKDRQTDMLIAILCSHTGGKVTNKSVTNK